MKELTKMIILVQNWALTHFHLPPGVKLVLLYAGDPKQNENRCSGSEPEALTRHKM